MKTDAGGADSEFMLSDCFIITEVKLSHLRGESLLDEEGYPNGGP